MLKSFKLILLIAFLCLPVMILGQSITYRQVSNSISHSYEYILSYRKADGSFSAVKNGNSVWSSWSTTLQTLSLLNDVGFPRNTEVFSKGINFLAKKYPGGFDPLPYFGISTLLDLQGNSTLQLSTCAKMVKNTIVKDYIMWGTFFNTNPTKPSSNDFSSKVGRLFSIETALDVVRDTSDKTLLRIMDMIPATTTIKKADIEEMLPYSLTDMYKGLSRSILKSYDVNDTSMILSTLAKLNDVVLNGHGEKTKRAILNEVGNVMNDPMVKKMISKTEESQLKDGSWSEENLFKSLDQITSSTPSTYQRNTVKLYVAANNISSLLKCGVPATNTVIEKAVRYLISHPLKSGHYESRLFLSFEYIRALSNYLKARWGKTFDLRKAIPQKYLKKSIINEKELSNLLNDLYTNSAIYYINDELYHKFSK